MRTKRVKVGADFYELTALTCDKSGAISIELISDVAPLVVAFSDGNIELFNQEIRKSVNSEKLMRIFIELINPNVILKNNELIKDWKEEFQCKPLTLFQLGFEALRFNCEDFFTFISGFLKEMKLGENLNEVIKNLEKEGAEIPTTLLNLFQNGNPTIEPTAVPFEN